MLSALDLDPTAAGIHYNVGVILLHQGKYQQALERFVHTLAVDTQYAKAHHNLSVLYAVMDPPDTERAVWHAAQAKMLEL